MSICLSNVTCDVYVSVLCSQDDEDHSENLQVYLRVRPLTLTESNNGESQVCFALFLFVTLFAIIPIPQIICSQLELFGSCVHIFSSLILNRRDFTELYCHSFDYTMSTHKRVFDHLHSSHISLQLFYDVKVVLCSSGLCDY